MGMYSMTKKELYKEIYFILGNLWRVTEDDIVRMSDTKIDSIPTKVRKLLTSKILDLIDKP